MKVTTNVLGQMKFENYKARILFGLYNKINFFNYFLSCFACEVDV